MEKKSFVRLQTFCAVSLKWTQTSDQAPDRHCVTPSLHTEYDDIIAFFSHTHIHTLSLFLSLFSISLFLRPEICFFLSSSSLLRTPFTLASPLSRPDVTCAAHVRFAAAVPHPHRRGARARICLRGTLKQVYRWDPPLTEWDTARAELAQVHHITQGMTHFFLPCLYLSPCSRTLFQLFNSYSMLCLIVSFSGALTYVFCIL